MSEQTASRVDVILDLETLGTKPGCVVLQVGAIAFRRQGFEMLSAFDRTVDIGSCLLGGLTVDPETLAWWRMQPVEAQASVFGVGDRLRHVATAFRGFWKGLGFTADSCVWARGADFDPAIWAAALRAADGQDPPWRYSQVRDVRTALDVLGVDAKAITRGEGVKHTALADAAHDLMCLRIGEARA